MKEKGKESAVLGWLKDLLLKYFGIQLVLGSPMAEKDMAHRIAAHKTENQ